MNTMSESCISIFTLCQHDVASSCCLEFACSCEEAYPVRYLSKASARAYIHLYFLHRCQSSICLPFATATAVFSSPTAEYCTVTVSIAQVGVFPAQSALSSLETLEESPVEQRNRVAEPLLPVHRCNFLHVFFAELEIAFDILLDPGWGLGLWNHAMALSYSPGWYKSDLDANPTLEEMFPINSPRAT